MKRNARGLFFGAHDDEWITGASGHEAEGLVVVVEASRVDRQTAKQKARHSRNLVA